MRRIVSEPEFRVGLWIMLDRLFRGVPLPDYVTGPGRSGAVAAVYASHDLGIPFVPYGFKARGRPLIIDTARMSGKTMRRAMKKYAGTNPMLAAVYEEPPIVRFWYEQV